MTTVDELTTLINNSYTLSKNKAEQVFWRTKAPQLSEEEKKHLIEILKKEQKETIKIQDRKMKKEIEINDRQLQKLMEFRQKKIPGLLHQSEEKERENENPENLLDQL